MDDAARWTGKWRVWVDAFATLPDNDIGKALNELNDISLTYQASPDDKSPLFRRVQRGGKS
jgi:uncharacterized protein (DUF934 family)